MMAACTVPSVSKQSNKVQKRANMCLVLRREVVGGDEVGASDDVTGIRMRFGET